MPRFYPESIVKSFRPKSEEKVFDIIKNEGVVKSENIITAQGAGVAWEFGERIAREIKRKK